MCRDINNKLHWYVRDRLGSVRAVVDASGAVVQAWEYYASGVPVRVDVPGARDVTDRGHIGNRWIAAGGLSWWDNTARMHDPLLARFLAPDPLQDKFPSLSPYSHCAANPLNFIDLTGRDHYRVDEMGVITLTQTTDDDFDTLLGQNDHSMRVDKSFMASQEDFQITAETTNWGKVPTTTTLFSTADQGKGRDIFNFMINNTAVEWGLTFVTGENYDKAYLGTSHKTDFNATSDLTLKLAIEAGENMTLFDHNHPNGWSAISDGDMDFLNKAIRYHPDCRFGIIPLGHPRFEYDKNSHVGEIREMIFEFKKSDIFH